MVDQKIIKFEKFNKIWQSWDHELYGIKGVGANRYPIINMDKFIDQSMNKELDLECYSGIAKSSMNKMGMFLGSVPPEFSNGYDGWSEILRNIQKYDPNGSHTYQIEKMIKEGYKNEVIYKYLYFALGATIPWYFVIYLITNTFTDKNKSGRLTDEAKNFPLLMEYLKTLPFKEIGRVMFFCTYPNAGVTVHRDLNVAEHNDHNINLFFESGWRPTFIYDEINKKKTYLEKESHSYFFNNRDYHGVDPEAKFRYTLRVDGTFNDEICDILEMEDGMTWKWSYE